MQFDPGLIWTIVGAVGTILAHKLGIPVPMLPKPEPVPLPVADVEPTEFLSWLLKVKQGTIKLDQADKDVVKLIKAAITDEMVS